MLHYHAENRSSPWKCRKCKHSKKQNRNTEAQDCISLIIQHVFVKFCEPYFPAKQDIITRKRDYHLLHRGYIDCTDQAWEKNWFDSSTAKLYWIQFLASQDALEVMRVTHGVIVSIDFTDVTLVSEDTHRRPDPDDPEEHDDPDDYFSESVFSRSDESH